MMIRVAVLSRLVSGALGAQQMTVAALQFISDIRPFPPLSWMHQAYGVFICSARTRAQSTRPTSRIKILILLTRLRAPHLRHPKGRANLVLRTVSTYP